MVEPVVYSHSSRSEQFGSMSDKGWAGTAIRKSDQGFSPSIEYCTRTGSAVNEMIVSRCSELSKELVSLLLKVKVFVMFHILNEIQTNGHYSFVFISPHMVPDMQNEHNNFMTVSFMLLLHLCLKTHLLLCLWPGSLLQHLTIPQLAT